MWCFFFCSCGFSSTPPNTNVFLAFPYASHSFAAPGDMNAKVTFAAFEKWYENSLFWTQQKAAGDEVADQTQSMWDGTKEGFKDLSNKDVAFQAKLVFILTLPIALFLSCIPDCRPPGQEKKATLTFFGSIFAIAVFAILMVSFTCRRKMGALEAHRL